VRLLTCRVHAFRTNAIAEPSYSGVQARVADSAAMAPALAGCSVSVASRR